MAGSEIRRITLFNSVTPDGTVVPKIEFAVGDDRIRPRFLHRLTVLWLTRGREPSVHVIGLRRRLDESSVAVFSVKIETTVSIAEGRRAQGSILPFDFAVTEVEAKHGLSGRAVEVTSNLHCAA